ncbi:MAG TPA: hypothetical protein VME17_14085 [Bryobacteraceae bacterium]|nr:hypothetical protein [Bryobacteraceae bacterium]
MPSAKLIVAVAAAILFAQIQCVAACAADACGGGTASIPPCHEQHDHSPGQTPAPCSLRLITTPATSLQAPHLDAPSFPPLGLIATISLVLPAYTQSEPLDFSDPSPPGAVRISSTILRI